MTFVARGEMLAAMREGGLEIRDAAGSHSLQTLSAVGDPSEAGGSLTSYSLPSRDTTPKRLRIRCDLSSDLKPLF